MSISIGDVAERAQVSISTVSRVINGRNIVKVNTRRRVEKAIRDLGYRPNIFARGLMLQRSNILSLVLPDLHGEFYSEIIRGANLKARQLGYHLLVSSVEQEDDGRTVLSTIEQHGMSDGVAIMMSDLNARCRASLVNLSVPFVVLDGQVEGVRHDTVRIDQRQGALALTRHLIAIAGAERIIFVGGHETNIDTRERRDACRAALLEAGLSLAPQDTYFLDYEYKTAFDLAERQIREWVGPRSCVFAANDEMAAGVIHAALSRRISVPDELGVVGFDDTRLARIIRPRLTTVHVPMAMMGASVVELLCQRLSDPDRPGTVLTLHAELVVRESCGGRS